MTPAEIPGGYVLLSRRIFDGSFAGRPPWEFALWVWMLAQANHKTKRSGQKLGRGQLLTTLAQMQEAVAYMVGGRRVAPGKPAIAKYLRRQREGNAVATAKTTRGLIITICQYDYYQTASNYESNGENPPKARRRIPERAHDRQEGQEGQESKKKETSLAGKPAAVREPNPWWDAIVEVFGITPITKTDKTRMGKLAREFQAKCEHAERGPDEIGRRRDNLADKWNDADKATPEATLKWWDLAATGATAPPARHGPDTQIPGLYYDSNGDPHLDPNVCAYDEEFVKRISAEIREEQERPAANAG